MIIRVNDWIAAFTGTMLLGLWYESSQDLGIFCYRIGCNVLAAAHRNAIQFAPVPQPVGRNFFRNNAECSIPSFTSSARYTTPKD